MRAWWLLPTLCATACYRPQPLDPRAVLEEQRAAAGPRGPGAVAGALLAEEAVELARRHNPDLRALRPLRRAAEGELIAARAIDNPTVSLQLSHLQRAATGGVGWELELGWRPPQPWAWAAQGAAAQAGAGAVEGEIAELELQLALAVRGAHADLLAAQDQLTLVERALANRRRIVELLDQRVAMGASTRLDQGLGRLALTQLERDRDEQAARVLTAGRTLAELVGVPGPLVAAGAIPEEPRPPRELEELEETAITARPALAAARARYDQREQLLRLEHANRWPWFRLTGAPRYRFNWTQDNPSDFIVGVQITAPLWNWNSGPIRIAEALRDQQRERVHKVVASLRRQLAGAREEIALRRRTLVRYRDTVLPAVESQERLLAAAAEGGQIDLVARLTAEEGILRSRREHIDVLLAHHRAWLDLERAVGGGRGVARNEEREGP